MIPTSLPPQYSTQTIPQNSPQQGSSTLTNVPQFPPTVQVNTTTPIRTPPLPILPYTSAQNTQTQMIQSRLTINTLQSNPIPNCTSPRKITRSPLQFLPTNPLSFSLTSTSPNNTQHSTMNKNQLNTLNPPSTSQPPNTTQSTLQPTQFQTSHSHSTTFHTNPHIHRTWTQPLAKTQNTISNASNMPPYKTIPPYTIPQSTVPHPTFTKSATAICGPIKP